MSMVPATASRKNAKNSPRMTRIGSNAARPESNASSSLRSIEVPATITRKTAIDAMSAFAKPPSIGISSPLSATALER